MADKEKTFILAAALAAAVGVYAEMSYQDKLKEAARLRELRAAPLPAGSPDPALAEPRTRRP
jgi:hypothetical protein